MKGVDIMADEKKIPLTKEEFAEKTKNLPERVFLVNGQETRGLYDGQEGRFYLLNADGTLNGKTAVVQKSALPTKDDLEAQRSAAKSNKRAEDDGVSVNTGSKDDGVDEGDTEDEILKRKKPLFAGVIGVLVIILLVVLVIIPAFSKPSNPGPATVTTTSPPATTSPDVLTSPVVTVAPIEEINVVQVVADLIPGDVITQKDIQCASISHETYNQISVIADIYKWEDSTDLVDKYINTYIPAGRYLSLDSVSSVYTPQPNPWVNEQGGMEYVSIPLTGNEPFGNTFNFGTIFDLSIQKKTVNETPNTPMEGESPEAVEGLEHQTSVQQSVLVDSYQMTNLIVCDILNSQGESIYGYYLSFVGIPVGKQPTYIQQALMNNDELEGALMPAAIRVKMTTEQAAALGDLTANNVTIEFKLKAEIDATSESKTEFAAEARALYKTIGAAIEANNKAMEEASANE